MTMLALLLSLVGFASLALAMPKHHHDLFGRSPSKARKRALGVGGWLLLGASIWPLIASDGVAVGITFWFGVITVAALIVAMSLTYGPAIFRTLSRRSGRETTPHHERSNHEAKRHAAVRIAAMSSEIRK